MDRDAACTCLANAAAAEQASCWRAVATNSNEASWGGFNLPARVAIEICQGCGSVAFLQRGYMSESKPKKKWQPKDRDWRSNASAASDGGKDARMAEVSDLTTQVKAKERAAGFTESEHEDAQSLERMKAKNREDAEAAAKMRVEEGAAAEKKKAEEEAAAAAKKD